MKTRNQTPDPKLQADARRRIEKAIALLDQVVELLGDGDDLVRALAGVTHGMVESDGNAKEATWLASDARSRLRTVVR